MKIDRLPRWFEDLPMRALLGSSVTSCFAPVRDDAIYIVEIDEGLYEARTWLTYTVSDKCVARCVDYDAAVAAMRLLTLHP